MCVHVLKITVIGYYVKERGKKLHKSIINCAYLEPYLSASSCNKKENREMIKYQPDGD
jgi:hypothetical protein